jgi:hypothetical protein
MKGIARELSKMSILLKPKSKLVRQRTYWLNPKHNEKVKAKLNRMIEASIIEPVTEFEWIIPMVVQDTKTWRIRICVYLRKLNDAYLNDLFSTPFTYKVL